MKGIKNLAKVVTGIIILLGATSAMAAVSMPAGWYLEGDVGGSRATNKNYPGVPSNKNTGTGWNASAGYKFMPFFAAEIGYTRYADTRLLNSQQTTIARDKHYSYDIAAKAMLPLGASGAEVYAKLGVARINSKIGSIDYAGVAAANISLNTGNKSATGLFIGLGAGYWFMPCLAGNLQWAMAKGNSNTGNLELLSVGLQYLFG